MKKYFILMFGLSLQSVMGVGQVKTPPAGAPVAVDSMAYYNNTKKPAHH